MKASLSLVALATTVSLACAPHNKQTNYQPVVNAAAPDDKDAGVPVAVKVKTNKVSRCPSDMVEVEGYYCPNLEVECLYNIDVEGKKLRDSDGNIMRDLLWSCGEYKYPTKCLSKNENLVHMHFCMDRYEWPNQKDKLPQDWMTYFDAKKDIEAAGKRLCTAREWTLAAEGPDRKPVPYGDGYHRDKTACNFDNLMPTNINVFMAKKPDDKMSQMLRGFLVPSGSMPRCVSDYGVHDMAGNIDEWVVNESSNLLECPQEMIEKKQCKNVSYRSSLKGGHIWHVRNASRPITVSHNADFGWYETGTRACKDIQ